MMASKQNKHQGNIYDRIFKENAETLFLPLVAEKLGLDIRAYKVLPEKLPRTLEREVDFLFEIEMAGSKKQILHIEFQTREDKNMIYRMGMYHGLVWEKYKLPVKHVVIYLGKGKTKMQASLSEEEVFTGYDIINLNELDTNELLSSQVPEVIILALLSHHGKERSERILRLIVKKIQEYGKSSGNMSKYINQLVILSRLRNLEQETLKIIRDMLIEYNVENDFLYKEGIEKGIEKGLEKGLEKGVEKGTKQTTRAIVLKCLEMGMSIKQISEITGASKEEITQLSKK